MGGHVLDQQGVVYDGSDEIAKPAVERSAAWKSGPIFWLLAAVSVTRPAGRHFYIIQIGC
jgi:hypothetical protein